MEIKVNFADKEFSIDYSITNATLNNITPDVDAFSVINIVESVDDGELCIKLPRELIDSKRDDKKYDDDFFVLIDGEEAEFKEVRGDSIRELLIPFPKEAEEIEIIGTKIGENYQDTSVPKEEEIKKSNEDSDSQSESTENKLSPIDIYWLSWGYPQNGQGTIEIKDRNRKGSTDKPNSFSIKVWSDSDSNGINIWVIETEINSGIFRGIVNFSSDERSSESKLHVSEGDTITAEYTFNDIDETQKVITSTTMIPTLAVPLERIHASGIRIVDIYDNELAQPIQIGSTILIKTDIENNQEKEQQFAYIVTIHRKGNEENIEETTLASLQGKLSPGQAFVGSSSWTPRSTGVFVATVFVWEGLDNPTALSPPGEIEIEVADLRTEFAKETLEESEDITPPPKTVIIPSGTSVPGCEKIGRCFIPSTLSAGVNESINWENADTDAHTITSGTPEEGPNGIFDSGLMEPKSSFSHNFTKKGVYSYHCMVHPWQIGMIIIE